MTNQEFSDLFDVMFNNIMSDLAPGLNEYEKSIFLTKALDEIIKSYFNPKLNKPQEGFDGNEARLIDFSMIMRTDDYKDSLLQPATFDNKSNSKRIEISGDILMFINEFVDVVRTSPNQSNVRLTVVPLEYREYSRLMSKPYKRPLHYQAWRIIDNSGGSNKVELIVGPNDTISKYVIRYIKRPKPIILTNLDGVSIGSNENFGDKESYQVVLNPEIGIEFFGKDHNGNYISLGTPTTQLALMSLQSTNGTLYYKSKDFDGTKSSPCELDPILHQEILLRAVELAKMAYNTLEAAGYISNNATGASGTEKGIMTR